MSNNSVIKKSKYSKILLFSCFFPLTVHKMKSSNDNNIHQTNDKNIQVIIMQFLDYLHEVIQDNHDFISFKQYITNIIGEEIKKTIQDNISLIITEQQQIINMKQIINDKQGHIEQLELMIYELQALLRTKDKNMIVEKDFDQSRLYNNIPIKEQPSISFKNKITNFFTINNTNNKIIESNHSIKKMNDSVESQLSQSIGNQTVDFQFDK